MWTGACRTPITAIDQEVELSPGYWIEWGATFENQQRPLARLSLIVPVTIFFMFVLLYTAFNSVKYATLNVTTVPFGGFAFFTLISGNFSAWQSALPGSLI